MSAAGIHLAKQTDEKQKNDGMCIYTIRRMMMIITGVTCLNQHQTKAVNYKWKKRKRKKADCVNEREAAGSRPLTGSSFTFNPAALTC